jgi:hypothetical protein
MDPVHEDEHIVLLEVLLLNIYQMNETRLQMVYSVV